MNGEMACRPVSRRETQRQDRRSTIVQVASRYFLEHGYVGTTMSAIAATLGGSKGTLWSYYPSKEALFADVIDSLTSDFHERLGRLLDPDGDLRDTLRDFCRGFLERITSPDGVALYRLVIGDAGRFPEMGEIFHERAVRRTRQLVADYLADAMDRGRLRRDDPVAAARILSALCTAGCHQRLLVGQIAAVDAALLREDVDRALALFLRLYALSPR